MNKLNISAALSLPPDAVTQTFGCIGRKGAGKTYLAGVLAEQMLDIHAQVIVLDPVGNWWGLRVGSDGKSKGKDIFVIGGEHGDLPIAVDAGARLAQVLVGKGISAVLDVSAFRQGERKRFAADFAEEFFHLKKTQRSAVHLFVEEAQLFIPQRSGPDEARMLGAYENIIRLGRNYGIGATLITQRPQSVNKEVLSQVECLCVLQVNGAHERKALEEWVQEAGADRKLIGELPGLARGEGFVWSPSWLRVFERVRFAKKTTFDASATPEVGKTVQAALLSSVDVETLRADLKEIVDKAKADDPKVLRAEIADLKKQLAAKPVASLAPGERVDSRKLMEAQREAIDHVLKHEIRPAIEERVRELIHEVLDGLDGLVESIKKKASALNEDADQFWDVDPMSLPGAQKATLAAIAIEPAMITTTPNTAGAMLALRPSKPVIAIEGITRPQQKILESLGKGESIGRSPLSRTWTAFIAGVSPKSSSFVNNLGALRTRSLIDYGPGSTVLLTEQGRSAVSIEQPMTKRELHEQIFGMVTRPQGMILRALIEVNGKSLTRQELGARADASPTSSSFVNNLGALRSLGLIDYAPGSTVFAARDLVEAGGR